MALVRASSEAIGIAQHSAGLGTQLSVAVFVDSSAALAVTARRGNGKLRHVRIGHLWVQEAAAEGLVDYRKVWGHTNPADLLTKPSSVAAQSRLLPQLGQCVVGGHAQERLRLHGDREFISAALPTPGRSTSSGCELCTSKLQPRRGVRPWVGRAACCMMRLSCLL